jgi:hypothetical protein
VLADVGGREDVVLGEQYHDVGGGDLLGSGVDAGHGRIDNGRLGNQRVCGPDFRSHA